MESEIYDGTITTELISQMEIGGTIKLPSEKHDIASTRMSEVNKASRIIDAPNIKKWTLTSKTKELGYISITRLR